MNKELAKIIGTAARQARKALRLTQEDAAERVDVSVEFYARIERGTSLPSMLTFARIASALGISADALLGQHPMTKTTGVDWTAAHNAERPEIRRVLRRLRQASPSTLRLVSMLLKEFEGTDADQQSTPESESRPKGESSALPEPSQTRDDSGSATAGAERLSAAHGGDFEPGAHARPLRARDRGALADEGAGHGWNPAALADGDAYSRTA